jgi:hypothetical protein
MYARMLGLQYLAPGGFLCFVFLEGAVALGILLALAELVSWWGVLVLPAMVAAMVKLNDVVAGALIRPATAVRTRPASAGRTVSSGSPGAEPSGSMGVERSGSMGVERSGSMGVERSGSMGVEPSGSPGAETVRLSPTVIAQVGAVGPPPARTAWLRSAAVRQAAVRQAAVRQAADGTVPASRDEEYGTAPAMDGNALNGPPVIRDWTEDLDHRERRARQSGARRYE